MPKITTEQQQATRSFIEQLNQHDSLEELYNFVDEQFEGLDNTELKNTYGDLKEINTAILNKYVPLVKKSPQDHERISLQNEEFKKFIANCRNAYQNFRQFKKFFIANIFDGRKDQINLYYKEYENQQNAQLKQIKQTYADTIKKHKDERNQTLQQLDQELQDLLKAIKLEEQSSKTEASKKPTQPTTNATAKKITNRKKNLVKLKSKLIQSLEKVEHKLMELDVVKDPANLATLQSIEATLDPNAEHGAGLKQTSRVKKILGKIANLVRPSEKAKLSHTAPYTDSRSLESEDPVSGDQVQMEMQEDDEGTKFETPPTSDDEFANADGSDDKSERANYYKPISRSSVEPRFNPLTILSQKNPVRPSNPLTATDPDLLRSSKSRYSPGDDVVPSERSRTLADSSITSLSRIPSTLASNATSTDSPRIAAEPAITPPARRSSTPADRYRIATESAVTPSPYRRSSTPAVYSKQTERPRIAAEPTVTPPSIKPDTPKLDSMPANISIPQPVYSLDKKLVRPFNPLTTTDPDLLQRSARRDSQASSSVASTARSGRIADENIRKSGNQIELVPLDGVSSAASFNELTQQFHHDMLTTHKTKSSKPFQFSIKKLKKWFPNKPKPGNLVFEPNTHQDSNILGNIYLIENNSNKHRSAQISKNTMEIPTAPNGEISLSSYQILSILFNNISNKKNPPQVELNVNLNLIEPEMLKNILECGSLDHRSTSKKHKKPILTIKTPLLIKEGLEPTEMTNLAIIENHNDIVTRLLAKKSRWKKFTHWVKELGSSKRSEKSAEAVIFRHGSNGSIIESPKHGNPLTIPKKRYNKE